MDISEQFLPPDALPPGAPACDPDRRRRTWATTVHILGGLAFAASVPVGVIIIGLIQLSGSCHGRESAAQIDAARWNMFWVGVVWSLLPFSLAVISRLLHSRWMVWAILGALTLAYGIGFALRTNDLDPLFCF